MPEFVLHILKMKLIAAVILLLTELFSRLSRGRYASGWKYWVWFAVAVFSAGASEASFREAPAADREFCSGTTGENSGLKSFSSTERGRSLATDLSSDRAADLPQP